MIQLQIETIAYCNAACVFCPYPQMKRERGVMDMGLFLRIVDQARLIPQITSVCLTGLGEPLMDKHLFERLRVVRECCPQVDLIVYTNGSLLTVEKARRMREIGVNQLYVSLNTTDKEKRQQIMRLDDFERVATLLEEFIPESAPMQVWVKAIMSKDLLEADEHEAFTKRWGKNSFMHLEGNWAGQMWQMRIHPKTACVRALSQIMVLWDGQVSLCCFDGEGEVILGDLKTQTIKEVFNGELATSYRRGHIDGKRGELKLCATCTAI